MWQAALALWWQVHVVDSFAGLPTATNKKDNDLWSRLNYISVPQEEVRRHFEAYNLLDEQVGNRTHVHPRMVVWQHVGPDEGSIPAGRHSAGVLSRD